MTAWAWNHRPRCKLFLVVSVCRTVHEGIRELGFQLVHQISHCFDVESFLPGCLRVIVAVTVS